MDWRNRLENIVSKIKFQLHARGVDDLNGIRNLFDEMDTDSSGSLSQLEFSKFLSKSGIFLTTQELRPLFQVFDSNNDENISYGEFIDTLRNDMKEQRIAVVKHAFQMLDVQQKGFVSLSELRTKFVASEHPRVKSRQKTLEQVQREFELNFGPRAFNGNIPEQEFLEYYADVNATLPPEKDGYFQEIVLAVWGLKGEGAGITPGRLQQIQTTLYEKVRQKTRSHEDEGRTLSRAFQMFDRDGSGHISFNEFQRALEKFGCTFQSHELQALFNKFDADKSGKLSYEEFAGAFAKMSTPGGGVFSDQKEPPQGVIDKVKAELLRRGANGIRGLGIVFRRMDNNGDKKLDRYEFEWGLKENGHHLSSAELSRLFKYFDKNGDGKVGYDEFLRAIRGGLNPGRKDLVHQVYKKLDYTGDGKITIDDLAHRYDVTKHPKFKSGEMSKDEVLTEFMAQWDTIKKDGIVSLEEFEDYYQDISASIDRDDYFELMIRNAWHLAGGKGVTENTTIPRHLETDAQGKQRVVMSKNHESMNYDKSKAQFWGADL